MSISDATLSFGHSLVTTNNNVCDIIRWLEEDRHVVIHYGSDSSRCYHKCLGSDQGKDQTAKAIDDARIVNVFVYRHSPGIFDEYIARAGFGECSCSLEGRVSLENNSLSFVVNGRLAAL